jgi:hypothetical protein
MIKYKQNFLKFTEIVDPDCDNPFMDEYFMNTETNMIDSSN